MTGAAAHPCSHGEDGPSRRTQVAPRKPALAGDGSTDRRSSQGHTVLAGFTPPSLLRTRWRRLRAAALRLLQPQRPAVRWRVAAAVWEPISCRGSPGQGRRAQDSTRHGCMQLPKGAGAVFTGISWQAGTWWCLNCNALPGSTSTSACCPGLQLNPAYLAPPCCRHRRARQGPLSPSSPQGDRGGTKRSLAG